MRAEYRLLNKRKIESVLGFSSVRELSPKWEAIKQKNKEAWKALFRFEPGEVEILATEQLSQELQYFRGKYGRNYIDFYLRAVGSLTLATVAGVDVFRSALESQGVERTTVWRAVKKLEQTKAELEMLRKEPVSQKTLSTLYQELRSKIYLN